MTDDLLTASYDYCLPEDLIAQEAAEPRDAARLLVCSAAADHRIVRDLPAFVRKGDLLVLNRTRVIPARLMGSKETGGAVEVLLVHPLDETTAEGGERWRVMIRGKVRAGTVITIGDTALTVDALEDDGHRIVSFAPGVGGIALADALGDIPLPPYIKREATTADAERYQTVFGDRPGSVAAPTASLHLTPEILEKIEHKGIEIAKVELRVGPGTFKPVQSDAINDHPMHAEWCELPAETAQAMTDCRRRGGRVIAVGTTVVRTLESAHRQVGQDTAWSGWTKLFIHPPQICHSFDVLLTNFHLPKSTLLMLVASCLGRERLMQFYGEAVDNRYRFFSYGDAMLLANERAGQHHIAPCSDGDRM